MSGIQNQVSDQTNQAIALLGGATAQSYSAVSLNVSPVTLNLPNADESLPFYELIDISVQSNAESTSQSLERLLFDSHTTVVTLRSVFSNTSEEPSELPNGFVGSDVQNPELLSRFEGSSLEDESTFGIQQSGFSSASLIADESLETLTTGGAGFSLLDFIEQAVAQAEASQPEFSDTFDGGWQGEFRELLMDAVAQPIGSIALPQAGPLLADPREELSAYLG
ncbi:hypothetical protein [Limnobacter sp. P1]|jgi:hypothetical protein|uniref:hypothetical protein n=1 Tax=Limnobacter olei TaxID=3031298 RepID=UPI0023AF1FD7|nr:hypothetical protein [Limnobacter sp. P1]